MGLNRRRVLSGLGAASVAGIAGCIGGDNGSGGDADAMVGVLQPVTGDLGNLGGPIRDAAILPGTQLENEGVDFEIDIREEDTESTADAGVSGAQSLVDAGYPAITGAASSQVTITVAEDILIPNGVVGISPASTAPTITDLEDDDYIFRTCPSDALQGEVMAEVAYEERGLESAASFYLNNDYGQQLSDSFVGAFEDLGGEVTETVGFEAEQPSYTSALESALADDPDMMIVIGYPASGEQIFRDYYSEFDTGQTIMVTDGLRDGDLPGNVDNAMENVVGTAPLAAGPEEDAFNQLYQDEYGSEPGVFTAQAYDATAVNILASIAAGETTGSAIRDSLRDVANPDGEDVGPSNLADAIQMVDDGDAVNYQGASSSVNFDDNGDMQAVTYEIFEFSEDGLETVEEIDFEA